MLIDTLASKIQSLEDKIDSYRLDQSSSSNEGSDIQSSPDSVLSGYMDTFILDIYDIINRSILIGEYVCKQDFEINLSNIIDSIKRLSMQMSDLPPADSQLGYELIDYVNKDLSNYLTFVRIFHRAIMQPNLRYLDNDVRGNLKSVLITVHLPSLIEMSNVFDLNTKLAYLDLDFELDEKTLRFLFSILHKLDVLEKEISKTNIIDILKYKCKLLISKFNYKIDNEKFRVMYSYYDDSEQKLDLSSILARTKGFLPKLKGLSRLNIRDFEHYVTDQYKQIKVEDNSFYSYYILCKYFRYIVKSELLISRLIKSFQKLKFDNSFDESNALFCVNYLTNCKLSLFLETDASDSRLVNDRLKEIESLQISKGVKNYYPYLIVAEWYVKYLDNKIKDTSFDLSKDFKSFKSCLDKAESLLQACKDNVGCFMPFRPRFNECLEEFEVGNGSIPLFIRTSYTTPVEYEKEELRIEKLKSEYLKFNSIVITHERVLLAVEKIYNENLLLQDKLTEFENKFDKESQDVKNEVKEELKETQRGSVQILAIFATIVLFVSGSIQIMTKTTSVRDATIFLILFAVCIGFISTSIWLIVSKVKQSPSVHNFRLLLPVCFIIGGLCIVAYCLSGDFGKFSSGESSNNHEINLHIKDKDIESASEFIIKADTATIKEV